MIVMRFHSGMGGTAPLRVVDIVQHDNPARGQVAGRPAKVLLGPAHAQDLAEQQPPTSCIHVNHATENKYAQGQACRQVPSLSPDPD